MPREELAVDIPIWPTGSILPSPGVTSRQLSAQFSVSGCPDTPLSASLSVILAILIVASGQIRKNCPARCAGVQLSNAFPDGGRDHGSCSPLDTGCNLPWLNRDITPHFSFLTTICRQAPPVNPAGAPFAPALRVVAGALGATGGSEAKRGGYSITAERRSHQGRKPGTVRSVRKLASAEVPMGDLRRFCVCHRCASDRGIVGPHGS